jgi:hypothetical protein
LFAPAFHGDRFTSPELTSPFFVIPFVPLLCFTLACQIKADGIAPLAGSTYMTLGAVFIVAPVHVFYLKYLEEGELELSLGGVLWGV